jgi:molybdopterin-guanine dinucleotide biosynthesis protein B
VEGFKHESFPKIELCRPALEAPLLHPDDPEVIAVASDAPLALARPLPLLDLNRPEAIRDFLLQRVRHAHTPSSA